MHDASDDALIHAVLNGNNRAFRHLVERYEGAVAATVVGMLGPGAEADDVAQQAMIRLYRSLDRFRGTARLKTYVTRIAMNAALDALRKRKRRARRLVSRDAEDASLDEPHVHGEEAVGQREHVRLVRHALEKLSPPHRAVVVLRLVEGYSVQETADLLDVPYGTVLSRLSRAKDHLEALLRPYLDDAPRKPGHAP